MHKPAPIVYLVYLEDYFIPYEPNIPNTTITKTDILNLWTILRTIVGDATIITLIFEPMHATSARTLL